MMALPFVIFAAATGCALAGRRGLALGAWGIGLALTLFLFRHHATDALPLAF
ncbi:DUF5993 family protein [Hansschlegelia zhihuaiae]|uniref:DUF5993 family protein n=1 Tax=Hansschlegelia zhihuaiae TaxID=405005 RepID=UPI0013E8C1C5|nr:DUF5993 family protein [Hansschlegelia zhihuaiae]